MDIKDCRVGMDVVSRGEKYSISAVGTKSILCTKGDDEYWCDPAAVEVPDDTFDFTISCWYKDNILNCLLSNGESYISNKVSVNLKTHSPRMIILKQLNELLKHFEKEGKI